MDFGPAFGIVLKIDGETNIYRFLLPYLNLVTPVMNPNGYFPTSSIALLTFIQRRDDPMSDSSLTKDVYGYFDDNNIYRFTADATSVTITAVEKIALPSTPCISIYENKMIDVGRYQIAVYSACNCNSVLGQTLITNPSAWFYTISNKTWSCIDLGNSPTQPTAAWTVPVGTVIA